MQSVKMQGPASPSMVPDAPIGQPGAAKSKPSSAVLAQNFPTSGESTSIESKTGERSMKFSWIRRLKPRDELELSKGNYAEATSEMTHPDECWDAVEKMDRGVISTQPACFSREKASTKTDGDRARLNLKNDAIPNSEMQKVSEQKDCSAVDRQISGFIRGEQSLSNEVGKEIAATAAVLPSRNGFGPWLKLKNKAVLDTDRQNISDQKDRGAVDTERSGFVRVKESLSNEVGKESAATAAVLPSSAGFGPWVNLSSGRKPGGKPCLELERVGFSPWNVDNVKNTKLSMQVLESSNNAMLRYTPGSTQGETITLGKPPLPPIRSKPGLPPRPLSQKTKGFLLPGKVALLASGMSRGFLDQHTQGVHSSGQILETPSSRESVPVRQLVSVQLEETSKLSETKHAKSGSPFQKPRPLEGSFPDSTKATSKECGKGTPDCGQHLFPISSVRKGNNEMPSKHLIPISVGKASTSVMMGQQIGECSDDIATQIENDTKEFCEGSGSVLVRKRSFGEEIGDPKVAMGIKSLLQTASMEPNKVEMQQSPSESSHGTAKSDRADASASTTASLPWEMFIEAAGTSKKAREQFVEVYNRARDELKNQRTSQSTSRAPSREMDDGPRLTLGPCTDVPAHFIERQSLKHQEQSAGHFQPQGRLKASSTSLDHRTQSGMNLKAHLLEKEQQIIGLAEGKGRVTVPASEEGGLQGDNVYQSNFASSCKLTEGFRKGQMLPMERQHRVNLKASQGSDQDKACQMKFEHRSDALAQVHIKGVTSEGNTRNEGQVFSNNAAVNYQQLASKLKEHSQSNGLGLGAGSLSEHNDRQETTTPLLGKRPRGTFEDHAVSRVAEKSPITRRERPSRPHIWLQRWHPATIHDTHKTKGMPDAHVLSGVGQGSVRYLALGLKNLKDGDGCRLFGQTTEVKNTLADKEQGLEGLKMCSAKMLPSAAAMAIVGTAARQFCSAQPQRKGSFAFWSGFGMPAPRKLEPSQGKGKAKLLSETDS